MDDAVGVVLGKLREHHLEENTLVFYLSDNGAPNHKETAASNHPLRGYKAQLLDGGIREPFLVQWRGRLPAGKVDDRPVIQLDVLPTALAAAGLTPRAAPKLDGVNLLPYLAGDKKEPPHESLFWRYDGQRAVRMGDWKLLHIGKKTELYNLTADIGEKHNLAAEKPDKVRQLEAAWQSWNALNAGGRHGGQKKSGGSEAADRESARGAFGLYPGRRPLIWSAAQAHSEAGSLPLSFCRNHGRLPYRRFKKRR